MSSDDTCQCGHQYIKHDPEDGNCEAGAFPPCPCGNSPERAALSRKALIEYDMNGHEESADCFCGPRVEDCGEARLIVHNRTDN